jgi:hypothetical protein
MFKIKAVLKTVEARRVGVLEIGPQSRYLCRAQTHSRFDRRGVARELRVCCNEYESGCA